MPSGAADRTEHGREWALPGRRTIRVMTRLKLWAFSGLALAGTAFTVSYAAKVAKYAGSPLTTAVLVFAATSALTGFLGVLLTWVTYRLEAGRVPKPDVRIIDEGDLVTHWRLELALDVPGIDFDEVIEKERDRLIRAALEASSAMSSFFLKVPSSDDQKRFEEEAESYLRKLRTYLEAKLVYDRFWARARPLLLAFTNNQVGAPIEGALIRLQFPEDAGLRVEREDMAPSEPERPLPPAPPAFHSALLDYGLAGPTLSFRELRDTGLGSLMASNPPESVSGPTFEKDSLRVEYEVAEILHKVHEDNRDCPLLLVFEHSGDWIVPYEIRARNLPRPHQGRLEIGAEFHSESTAELG